ncbi:hypothetical protein G5I_13469 [Acromyrmex echinatior]|uniref:Uncharacterized protein n=1 Tax=Acromyrmex echinatior TaxID=103372 RepID=F4X537_ACREC|nr:hypothetical protein G5I_13469 [Acromyrmex echinatior]
MHGRQHVYQVQGDGESLDREKLDGREKRYGEGREEGLLQASLVSLSASSAGYIWYNRKNYISMLVCMLDAGVLDRSLLEPSMTRRDSWRGSDTTQEIEFNKNQY